MLAGIPGTTVLMPSGLTENGHGRQTTSAPVSCAGFARTMPPRSFPGSLSPVAHCHLAFRR